jgi:4-hydroxyacetophenone monooxygenase
MSDSELFSLDDAALEDAVQCANLPTLLMVLIHLTGDLAWMREEFRPKRASPQRLDGGYDRTRAASIRAEALAALRAFRDRGAPLTPLPEPALLAQMMSFSLGQDLPPEYVPMMLADMGLPSAGAAPTSPLTAAAGDFHVLIIGAGMSGLVAAIKLQAAGVRFTLIEKNPDVGGTWFENTYPGCRVDLPNHFYSLSFEPGHWPHHFSERGELLAYFQRIADKYQLRAHTRFETEVTGASYDTRRCEWQVNLRRGDGQSERLVANAIISAVGQLNRPSIPDLAGLSSFAGPAFHTARYRHDISLQGKRVAVIGTGASAMQLAPKLAPEVAQLSIFQRSPQWAIRNPDYFEAVPPGKQALLRHLPYYAAWYRFRLFYTHADGVHADLHIDPNWPELPRSINAHNARLRSTLTDYIERELGEHAPRLRERVIPDYPPFAKRMLLDNGWFRMLTRPNVALVSERIARVLPDGLETESGERHALDAIIFATGFQATRFLAPMQLVGAGGRALHEAWEGEARAHLGVSVPGFPNLFCLYGPNTNLAHGGSIIFHSECQMHYILGCLQLLFERGAAAMECTPAANDAYNAELDAVQARMVWALDGVENWFKSRTGRVATNSPFRLVDYWSMTRRPDPEHFRFHALG